MKVTFLGAAREVTGSNYLIETEDLKFLVDCGMFQGSKELESLNEEAFRFNPAEIDFLLVTHAHIDHSGRIPKLVKEGFKGKIYSTKPTEDLLEVMLKDSAKIQENDAEYENKRLKRAGKQPIEPLYTVEDVEKSLSRVISMHYNHTGKIHDRVKIRFKDAGHILGSSILEIWITEGGKTTKLAFSGDLGMPNRPIIKDPEFIDSCDYLFLESTYGNTVHEEFKSAIEDLIKVIDETANKGGTVIIPSFAVGRTQELIYELNKYYESNKVDEAYKIPIYIDSPMAVLATEVFKKNSYNFDEEAQELIRQGDNIFEFPNLHYVNSVEESKTLNRVKFPRVIISSSGMATAGRVRHHLKHNLWDPNSAIVFVGYQAVGSLGRIILDGAKEVKLMGETIAVKASVHRMEGFSGHADEPMLLEWVNKIKNKPKKIYLTHGEIEESEPLARVLRQNLGMDVEIAELWKTVELEAPEETREEVVDKEAKEVRLKKDLADFKINLEAFGLGRESLDLEKLSEEDYNNLRERIMDINEKLMDINLLLGK